VSSNLSGGAAGLIVAAIVAAALSPSLNAMAATTVNDFYVKYWNRHADERTLMRASRVATVGWGFVQLSVALGVQRLEQSVLDQGLAILSLTAGPVLGAFLLAVATRRIGPGPMVAGMVTGIASLVHVWMNTPLAFTWYACFGAAVTIATALILHLITGRAPDGA
jgi:Na+/proline symporter